MRNKRFILLVTIITVIICLWLFINNKQLSTYTSTSVQTDDTREIPTVLENKPEDDKVASLSAFEEKLLGAFIDTAIAGKWLAQQDEEVVPLVWQMLHKYDSYVIMQREGSILMGSFPGNAFYGLANMKVDKSKHRFQECILLKTEIIARCELSNKAYNFKQNLTPAEGIPSIAVTDITAYPQAAKTSDPQFILKPGDEVLIFEDKILNELESGPRGGENYYTKVIQYSTGKVGYVETAPDSINQFY